MAWPFFQMPTLDDLKRQLAAYGVRWVDLPDPSGRNDTGYFERDVGGVTAGCPVSVERGRPLNPSLISFIYRRLLINDDVFGLR